MKSSQQVWKSPGLRAATPCPCGVKEHHLPCTAKWSPARRRYQAVMSRDLIVFCYLGMADSIVCQVIQSIAVSSSPSANLPVIWLVFLRICPHLEALVIHLSHLLSMTKTGLAMKACQAPQSSKLRPRDKGHICSLSASLSASCTILP